MKRSLLLAGILASAHAFHAVSGEPKFRAVTIDDKIQIGYGLAVADVDGDGRPDILLADKKQFVWYRNPGQPPKGAASFAPPIWAKFVLAENLTEKDNVCIAAQDLDGDGKCEIAVGAEWNPADTEKSGAVFYLVPPADRTQPWEAVKFPSVEPTTHRMKWLQLDDGKWGLVVVPLHGRGNKNTDGAPVKVLLYHPPADPRAEWKSDVLSEELHATHNFTLPRAGDTAPWQALIAGKEGIVSARLGGSLRTVAWRIGNPELTTGVPVSTPACRGVGEVREGKVPEGHGFIAAIEPMHGNDLVVYRTAPVSTPSPGGIARIRLTGKLSEGHALACGDLLGTGSDQIVVGWRGKVGAPDSTIGVALWTPEDADGAEWEQTMIDPDGMACEDLLLADLNGDGKLDIVASGRATKNVKIYFNEMR